VTQTSTTRSINLLTLMIVIDAIGIGLIIPTLPPRIIEVTGDASSAALWTGILLGIDALLRFIFNPLVTSLSDRVGRKPILILAGIGSIIDYLLLAFVPQLAILVIGRMIGGVTNAYFPTINAYIADISTPQERVGLFGRIGASFGIGFVIGPVLGGVLGSISLQLPFLLVVGLVTLNLVLVLLFLPESLKPQNRQTGRWTYENPITAIRNLGRVPVVGRLAWVLLFLAIGEQILYSTWVLYTSTRYGWTTTETGLSLTALGLLGATLEGALIGSIVKRLGHRRTILLALVAANLTYIAFGLAPTSLFILIIVPFYAISYLYEPPVQTIITSNVPPDQQGTVQGALAGLTSIASAVGPLVGGGLLSYLLGTGAELNLPGGVFFLSALFSGIAIVLALRTFAKYPQETEVVTENAPSPLIVEQA
jgi:MFS transporter, DHA1 family, tetracycline resistance protein